MMGSPSRIAAGMGSFLIGGPSTAVEMLRFPGVTLVSDTPIAGRLERSDHELVSNLLLITGVTALAEGSSSPERRDLSIHLRKGVLADSFVVSAASKVHWTACSTTLTLAAPPSLARKDVRLAVDLADRPESSCAVGPATDALLTSVIDAGVQWPDFAAVIEALG